MKQTAVGVYEFTVDAYLSDFNGKATLPMIGNFMLQAATKHAEERGFGFMAMKQRGLAWVLSRMVIEIFNYPGNEKKIKVHTWVADINKLFTERCFAFEDEDGNYFGYSRSTWAAIDLNTRRPTNMLTLKEDGLDYFLSDKPCPIAAIKKILPINNGEELETITVKYSDVDINKHLNSMKYVEYFVNLFDISFFVEKEIKRIAINFIKEVHYGTQLQPYMYNESEDTYTMELRDGASVVSTARVKWGKD